MISRIKRLRDLEMAYSFPSKKATSAMYSNGFLPLDESVVTGGWQIKIVQDAMSRKVPSRRPSHGSGGGKGCI